MGARAFAFGSFLLVPERQLLLRDGSAMRIGGRALDLLTELVERPGQVVSKSDLMARAWPTTTVAECNLKVNILALRRALGDRAGSGGGVNRYIATVPGRGYRFIAPVESRIDPGLGRVTVGGWPALREPYEIVGYGVLVDGDIMLRLDKTVVLLKPTSAAEGD